MSKIKYSKKEYYYKSCNKGKLWNQYINSEYKNICTFELFLKTYKDDMDTILWQYVTE
jgi:hypothetical protein